jgi:hypothetical protein
LLLTVFSPLVHAASSIKIKKKVNLFIMEFTFELE